MTDTGTFFPDPGTYPTDPQGRPRITVTPKGAGGKSEAGSEWDDHGAKEPPAAAAPSGAGADAWDSHGAAAPPTPKRAPQIDTGDAAVAGLTNVFGAGPAVAGLAKASGIDQPDMHEEVGLGEAAKRAGTTVARPFVGAYNLLHDYITGSGDDQAAKAYQAGREASLDYNNEAMKQHPAAYIAGQLAQAVALPLSGAGAAARGAGAFTRMFGAAKAGAAGGALYGAGEGVSENKSLPDIAIDALAGAGTGAVLGGLGQGAFEGGAHIGGRVAQIVRGGRNSESEASRMVTGAFGGDVGTRRPGFTPRQGRQTQRALGAPVTAADHGGPNVQRLADWAARHSPEAKWQIQQFAQERFWGQHTRMASLVAAMRGRRVNIENLKRAARLANKPNYDRVYRIGSHGLWSSELERLTSSDDVMAAVRAAVSKWRSWQVADGYGAMNPGVTFNNGILRMSRTKSGYPDLRFWDLVHRELSGKIGEAVRSGNGQEAARLMPQHNALMAELDKIVPEFKQVRGDASFFKRGERAIETAQDLTHQANVDWRETVRWMARLSPAERQLASNAYASALITKLENGDRSTSVHKMFEKSERLRREMETMLGPNNARTVEAALAAERIMDRLRAAGGNSVTTEGLHGEQVLGGMGALETVKETGTGFLGILFSAVGVGAAKRAIARTDERIAEHVGEMLLSGDPERFTQAVRMISASRVLMETFRRLDEATTRVGVADVGGRNVIATGVAHYSTPHEDHHHHDPHGDQDLLPPLPQ